MGLFRKKKEIVVDERTNIEKTFESKGQKIGKETGELVQKGVDKINKLKDKYDVDDKVEDIIEKATNKSKNVYKKAKSTTTKQIKKIKKIKNTEDN